MDYDQKVISKLKIALAKARMESMKAKPNPDKIYKICNDALTELAGFQ